MSAGFDGSDGDRAPRRRSAGPLRALLALLGLGLSEIARLGLVLGLLGPWIFELDAFAHLRLHFALAALAGAVLLALGGWRILAAVSALVGAAGLALLWPVWSGALQPRISSAEGCRIESITVAFANVEGTSPRLQETVDALDGLDADVFAAVELRQPFHDKARQFLSRYKHAVGGSGPRDAKIWSRLPIRPAARGQGEAAFHSGYQGAVITVGGRPVGLAAVHLKRPLIDRQREMIEQAPSFLSGLPRDRVILGDLNATMWSHAMARFETLLGVRPAPGFRITWRGVYPNPFLDRAIPSVIGNQIDHVLASPGIGVRDIETFPLPGSVHEGLRAVIDIPSAECGPLDAGPAPRQAALGS